MSTSADDYDMPMMWRKCPECMRVFDLTIEEEADEFFNGHDCEEQQ